VYDVISSHAFELAIMVCISLNIVVLASTSYGEAHVATWSLDYLNKSFTIIFLAEATAKIVVMGPWAYWSDNWHKFDAAIIFASVPELFRYPQMDAGPSSIGIESIRIFRVCRIFKLLRVRCGALVAAYAPQEQFSIPFAIAMYLWSNARRISRIREHEFLDCASE
jgi:hypothetical protein